MQRQNYKNESDEQLILRYQNGENEIIEYLMNKYKNMVRKKAGSMFILGGDRDDLIQEGMIGLFKAVRDYDTGHDAGFSTFAELCISRQMYTAVQASGRQKHIPLNTYISIYSYSTKTEEEDGHKREEKIFLMNAIPSGMETNPEERLIEQENIESLEKAIFTELSSFEKEVLDLYLTGMTYTEIAKVLGREEKATDNALQRIKGKIKKILKSKDIYL